MKKLIFTIIAITSISCFLSAKPKGKTKTPGQLLDETLEKIQTKTEEVEEKTIEKGSEIKEKTEEKSKKAVENVKKAGDKMKKAVNDIMDIFQ